MLVLLSPAKTLQFDGPAPEPASEPRFARQAASIARAAARMKPDQLAQLMHISPRLAELNAARFRGFARAEQRPAIRAFAGDVYRGFDAASAEPEVLDYAQHHVRILSGLYGLLRPLDAIRPYRLEMGTRWAPGGGTTLIEHWGTRIARAVLADLKAEGSNILVNLASAEYFAAVGPHLPRKVELVTPDFRVRAAGKLRFESFTAKVARGTLARFICDERIEDPAALRHFDRAGWRFDEEGSTPARPLFIRG